MNDQEQRESIGRIEIAPEVLVTIAQKTTLEVDGVNRMASAPSDVGALFRRGVRQDGVELDYSDGRLAFDLYVMMEPHVNVRETSRRIQTAVIEAIDNMVGIAVHAVNVHVEDVVYSVDQTA